MVTMIRSDLDFILAQILIAEADARGEQLLGTYLPNSEIPWGLRRVDGSNNNLIQGQENYGAADQPFPRATTETFLNETDAEGMAFGPPLVQNLDLSLRPALPGETPTDFGFPGVPPGYIPGPGGNWLNNNDYGVQATNTQPGPRAIQPGDVVDADPRLISNLIVDQTANNPAAVFKALQDAGVEDDLTTAGVHETMEAAGAVATIVAAIKQARSDALAGNVTAQAAAAAAAVARDAADADASVAAAAQAIAAAAAADAATALATYEALLVADPTPQQIADALDASNNAAAAATAAQAAADATATAAATSAAAAVVANAAAQAAAADAAATQVTFDAAVSTAAGTQATLDAATTAQGIAAIDAATAAANLTGAQVAAAAALATLGGAEIDAANAAAALATATGTQATAQAAWTTAINNLINASIDLNDANLALLAAQAGGDPITIAAAQQAVTDATVALVAANSAFSAAQGTLTNANLALTAAITTATAANDVVADATTALGDAQATLAGAETADANAQQALADANAALTAAQVADDAADAAVAAAQTALDAANSAAQTAATAAIAADAQATADAGTAATAQADAVAAAAIAQNLLDAYNALVSGDIPDAVIAAALDASSTAAAAAASAQTDATAAQSIADASDAIADGLEATAAQAAADALAENTAVTTAEALLRTTLTGHGITLEESSTADILKATLFIGNVAPDEGLSAPFNGWMTLFGQFFDHGLDLVAKGGYGTVYIPLQPDDPLYVEGGNTNFMALTRSTLDPVTGEPINLTTPFVDQNQTYTSTPSAQVFHREYEMRFDAELGYAVPKATGRLLNGDGGGLATWADVKAQALNMLGIELDDHDIHRIPELLVDPYGNFIPGANGLPQIVTGIDGNGQPITAGAVVDGNGVITSTVAAADALATGHAFLDDIAHNANPGAGEVADLDNAVGLTGSNNGFYDDELLDAHFITGDGRGNENIGLTAVHQVFHSEHNRQVELVQDLLLTEAQDLLANGASEADAVAFLNQWLDIPLTGVDPGDIAAALSAATVASLDWNGERIFQAAKLPTEMQYQHLVFEEFARKVQPLVNIFNDYNAQLNPAIVAEFAHTVYRFGHSMLTETVDRLDANFNPIGAGGVAEAGAEQIGLIEAFLNPIEFVASGANAEEAAGNIIRGMTRQYGNEIDEFVTEALRNNLVGLPLDLAALNIARGRETGVPSLNEARAEFYNGSGDPAVKPYESWFEFAQNLKNPASVVNFIAAYGTHATILAATNMEEKRDAATALVLGTPGAPADRLDYLNHTGTYAIDPNRGGLNDIDFWIGGLAEKKYIFGGFLGSTFNFVFETQLEALQDGDRFYYLSRLANLNLTAQLENNKFSEMIQRNTTATHLPGDAFALPNYFLEVDITKQFNYGLGVGADPTTAQVPIDPFLGSMQGGGTAGLVLRSAFGGNPTGKLEYTGAEHVVLGGTDGNDHLVGGLGDDTLWGDGGDDRLEGGDGNDFIFGGLGNDIITDEFGINEIRSNEGDDVVSVGTDFNLIITDTGRDAVFGGNGADEFLLGQGDDFADGAAGADFMIGGEGNDWLESGTENGLMLGDNGDLVQGLPIKRSVDSRIEGHDVLLATGGNADFDAETGDDIMVGGLGTDRFFGQFGFDWATYKNDPFGLEADMNLRLFAPPALPGSPGAILDRYAQTEALSGSHHADILRGDDLADLGAGAVDGLSHVLLDSNVALIDGLGAFLGDGSASPTDEVGATRFSGGNILLGGDGSDLIEGRGGNDLIDGDRWLNVRIVNVNDSLDTHDTLAGFKSRLIAGEIAVADLQIVRELVVADGSTDVDTAQFSGALSEYSIEGFDGLTANDTNGDGFISVSHDTGGVGLGTDGVDQLKNIERLRFADQTIDIVDLTGINSRAQGQPTISEAAGPTTVIDGVFEVGEVLSASIAGVTDADNVTIANPTGAITGTIVFNWQVELVAGSGVFTNIERLLADELVPVTGATMTLSDAEGGFNLRVVASFKDAAGVIESVVSDALTVAGGAGGGPLGAPVVPDPAAALGIALPAGALLSDGTVLAVATVGIEEDEPGGFTFSTFDLLANATDPNPTDILSVPLASVALRLIVGDPSPGTLVDNGDLTFTFTPALNFNGGVTILFDVTDGVNVVPAEAILEVLPINDAPEAPVAFVVATAAAAAAPTTTFTEADLFGTLPTDAGGNAIDIDGDRLAVDPLTVALANPAQGTLTEVGGVYTFTAAATVFGDVAINYTIDDGAGLVNSTVAASTALVVGRTFAGTGGVDNVSGTISNDVLNGIGGADILSGLAGNDTLNGGNGADTLNGGDGDDTLNGGAGNDTADGGAGDDLIVLAAAQGRDIVRGGEGAETIGDTLRINGAGVAEIFRIFTANAAAAAGLTGLAAGTDIVVTRNTDGGVASNANIIAEVDQIEEIFLNTTGLSVPLNDPNGGTTNVILGADVVQIIGDFTTTDLAFNTIHIDNVDGDLTLDVSGFEATGHGVEVTNYGSGSSSTSDESGDERGNTIRTLHSNSGPSTDYSDEDEESENEVEDEDEDEDEDENEDEHEHEDDACDHDLTGNSQDNTLVGCEADDYLEGRQGRDLLLGAGGSDTLDGGEGDDKLDGGLGSDMMRGGGGNDVYIVDDANDTIHEGATEGIDTGYSHIENYSMHEGIEYLALDSGAVSASGNSLDNWINGNDANNTLHGNDGHDQLQGNAGRDYLFGGEGVDTLWGGAGPDHLTGGQDTDFFYYHDRIDGGDTIADFVSGIDRIRLRGDAFDFAPGAALVDGFNFVASETLVATNATATMLYNTGNGQLWFDSNGTDAGGEFFIASFVGPPPLHADDFQIV